MRFLKDVAPMSAPLGEDINATALEPIQQTQRWFKIDGDQIVPRDAYYDLRLTDEYWETYFIDYCSLLAVDHPQESNIYVDERVADPPPRLKLHMTGEPRNFAGAKDDTGRDVSGVIQRVNANYLNTFGVWVCRKPNFATVAFRWLHRTDSLTSSRPQLSSGATWRVTIRAMAASASYSKQ